MEKKEERRGWSKRKVVLTDIMLGWSCKALAFQTPRLNFWFLLTSLPPPLLLKASDWKLPRQHNCQHLSWRGEGPMWCEVTGFYLKILFRSDTETHKSAFFFPPRVCADFNRGRERLERNEKNELREMRWKKLNAENITWKEMENRKENVIFASSAAEQKIPQAEQQISSRQNNNTLCPYFNLMYRCNKSLWSCTDCSG